MLVKPIMERREMLTEENAIVLDYLARGKPSSYKTEAVAQVIGTEHFTLLEIVPKAELKTMEEVYIGREEREKVERIKQRITYGELTNNSIAEIEKAIETIVGRNEKRFVEFFNTAGSITIRRHTLELLPGMGKKHLFSILEERQKKPFESFSDIEQRVHLMPSVLHTIVKRIVEELMGEAEKHYLFARPPVKKEEFFQGRRERESF